MNKQAITTSLNQHYKAFTEYINGLPEGDYTKSYQQKWTAGQQLEHIVICVKPLVQVFSMAPAAIAANFGTTDRAGRSYATLLHDYQEKLNAGGKAPARFLPDASNAPPKNALIKELESLVSTLCSRIENFTEEELDTLCLPHPLLGNISIREMLYNAILPRTASSRYGEAKSGL